MPYKQLEFNINEYKKYIKLLVIYNIPMPITCAHNIKYLTNLGSSNF